MPTSASLQGEKARSLFDALGLPLDVARNIALPALNDFEDGELFLEHSQSEGIVLDDGRIRSVTYDVSGGFGLRGVLDEGIAFAHSSRLDPSSLKEAASTVQALRRHHGGGTAALSLPASEAILYRPENPLERQKLNDKIAVLQAIDTYARRKDPRVVQVSASLSGETQIVYLIGADGREMADIRPLVRMNVSIVVQQGDRRETGSDGQGGRYHYDLLFKPAAWKAQVDEALRQALINLEAKPAPAGEMPVVLGPGWPGVLLHEAVGHGLEGDFNRKETSAFAGLMGQRVAAPGVTVIDDGTLPERRGSLSVDDEGTPTGKTVLIEDGILVGYLQDRLNARLMGAALTGNGRRESYDAAPLPRMTNTYMLAGQDDPADIIASVSNGIYAVNFGGGQVDITSGKFVFSASEAYRIENGKITSPIKGATLIGNGPDCLTKVKRIGNDLKLDPGIGTCGKDGQSVPVGVGQPTLLLEGLTVGGTQV
ncbi:MAG: metalloprotease TldD [Holosporales bacterium]